MSKLFECVNKIIPYDDEAVTYISELASYHGGFRSLLAAFMNKVESNKLEDDVLLLQDWVDSIQSYLDHLCSIQDSDTLNVECLMYDAIMVMGLYSIADGYINSGILGDKLEQALGDKSEEELSRWALKNPCSYYYPGENAKNDPTSECEEIYLEILFLQKRIGALFHGKLMPFFESISQKCGISCYAPQYYEYLKCTYGHYYELHPEQGIVMHKNHVFDVRANRLIKMDQKCQTILYMCFRQELAYLLSIDLPYLQKLINNNLVTHSSLRERLSQLYEKRKSYNGIKGVLHLELTHKCNLNCKHCFNRTAQRHTAISNTEWLSIIEQFAHLGQYYTILFGGEPTLYKDIESILKKLVDVNFPIELFTNATLIDDDYAKMLAKYKLAKIKVSIDGDNSIRGAGSFERAIQGLTSLTQYANAPVFVNVTICTNNLSEIESIVKLCKEKNVAGIGFAPMQSVGNAALNNLNELSVNSELTITQFIIALGKKYSINVGMERFCEGPFDIFRSGEDELYTRATPCDFGVAMYYVRSDGLLAFCPDLTDEKHTVALTNKNIEKAGCSGIEDLRYPTEKCSKCTLFYMCFGACKATIFHKHDNFNACDESNKERIELTLDAIIRKYGGTLQ